MHLKYCSHCGAELLDAAVICVKCGCSTQNQVQFVTQAAAAKDDTLDVVIKIVLIIACVIQGIVLLPLAWCIPMTVSIFKKINSGEPISTGLKVCTLLFVSLLGGICLLCRKD